MQAFRLAAAASVAALLAAPAFAQDAAAPTAPVAAPAVGLAVVTPNVVAKGDTIETLKAAGQFSTLLKALDATNLTGVVKAQKTLTVFAPTDAAFAALPAGELDKLQKDPAAMQQVLVYHLINAPIEKTKIAGAKGPVATVAGSGLVLDGSAEDGALKANDAHILVAEVKTTSGVVYVVDKVLTPEGAAAAMAVPAPEAPAEAAPAS
ncbi:fasciclin domain-containing protein [Caulobacter mirabilis]|uniref:FAS1 domain-containing protein n=1 Tax=Caulobacter mirabilis TaxID=69666 RepID=A0A2D2AZN9_9CAUL|nr:fasciclin domain-containing protein [Caulobacter mirabilis]ATQ43478.1 hypothetical protein CSW64_14190 [Caulobacter mirabilis]